MSRFWIESKDILKQLILLVGRDVNWESKDFIYVKELILLEGLKTLNIIERVDNFHTMLPSIYLKI